jgi:large subunit ribosomal protein L10
MNNDTVKVSKNRQKKEVLIAELTEKIEKSNGMVFANYQGLTHQQLEGFKKNLKKVNSEFVAVKNTLLQRALANKIDKDASSQYFKQPTGAMFIYKDIVDPLK